MIGVSVGPYKILEPLGSGGMGDVYLAEDTRLGRKVAIKLLPPKFADDASRMARFEQEARAISALNHPGICTLHDLGEHEGRPFLVMEALEGDTLEGAIGDQPLPIDRILDIAVQTAAALAEAHASNVIHRDLKAANIFVTERGVVKILDFGLAKLTPQEAPGSETSMATSVQPDLTREGARLGTVAYMSPEQARGQSLDARSDLFSFGVVLYQMATGQLPFVGATDAVVFDQILNREPIAAISQNPRIPTGLVHMIERAMRKDPEERFGSAREMVAQIDEIRRAPGSLESLLPTEHISSTASIKPPPRETESMAPDAAPQAAAASEPPPSPLEPSPSPGPPATNGTPSTSFPPGAKPSIAVLPFANMSPDPDNAFFCDGLAEELIITLTGVDGLDVAARTSTFQFKDKHEDVRAIAAALGVNAILEGSVRKAGNRLRISAQLIKASDGYHLWSERYDREMEDIFEIQDDIAAAIVDALKIQLMGEAPRVRRRTENLEAYDLYLRGRHFWTQRRPDTMRKAIDYFERAIELDPEYALPYAGLSDAYSILGAYQLMPADEAMRRAKPMAEKALQLDDQLPEAHFSKAWLQTWWSRNWWEAEPSYLRALELNPADPVTRVYYGFLLSMMNRPTEAEAQVQEALRLDPLSPFVHGLAGMSYKVLGDHGAGYDEAIRLLQRGLEIDPSSILCRWLLAFCHHYAGRSDEAIDLMEEVCEVTGRQGVYVSFLFFFCCRAGRVDEAEVLREALLSSAADSEAVPWFRMMVALGTRDLDALVRLVEEGKGTAIVDSAPAIFCACKPDLVALSDDPVAGPAVRQFALWSPGTEPAG